MTSYYWAKLWIDLLDDRKVWLMPDWLFRRFILLLLAAKEYNREGLLQPVPELAWRLRLDEGQVADALSALSEIEVAKLTNEGWLLVNFAKRQKAVSAKDRKRLERSTRSHELVTYCDTETEAESETEERREEIREPDTFDQIQEIAIRLTGLMVLQSDLKTLYDWEREKVTESDIKGALQWRKDNDKPPIKTISQLAGGVKTERSKRIQGGDGREPSGKLPQKPDDMDSEIFQALEYLRLNRYREDVSGRAANRLDRLKFLHEKGLAMEIEK